MATRYACDIANGEITDLATFAWRCARAFGALVHMRDLPLDAPIPLQIEPNTKYHDDECARADKKIDWLNGLSDDDAAMYAYADFLGRVNGFRDDCEERALTRYRYQSMLEQVSAWDGGPPELKQFMLEQLRDSILHDSNDRPYPVQETTSEWRHREMQEARDSLACHMEQRVAEITRVDECNAWLDHLRSSLLELLPLKKKRRTTGKCRPVQRLNPIPDRDDDRY